MFDFDYWFDGVVGICELIVNKNAFRRAWILGDTQITSIHYYDELFEQLIGDLHLDESIHRFAEILRATAALDVVIMFATAVHQVDKDIKAIPSLQDAEILLSSQEWAKFQLAAKTVIELPVAQQYRSGDFGWD